MKRILPSDKIGTEELYHIEQIVWFRFVFRFSAFLIIFISYHLRQYVPYIHLILFIITICKMAFHPPKRSYKYTIAYTAWMMRLERGIHVCHQDIWPHIGACGCVFVCVCVCVCVQICLCLCICKNKWKEFAYNLIPPLPSPHSVPITRSREKKWIFVQSFAVVLAFHLWPMTKDFIIAANL